MRQQLVWFRKADDFFWVPCVPDVRSLQQQVEAYRQHGGGGGGGGASFSPQQLMMQRSVPLTNRQKQKAKKEQQEKQNQEKLQSQLFGEHTNELVHGEWLDFVTNKTEQFILNSFHQPRDHYLKILSQANNSSNSNNNNNPDNVKSGSVSEEDEMIMASTQLRRLDSGQSKELLHFRSQLGIFRDKRNIVAVLKNLKAFQQQHQQQQQPHQ